MTQEKDFSQDQPATVEGAQGAVNQILGKVHEMLKKPNWNGKSLDSFEPVPDDLQQELGHLRNIFFSLPPEVESISVGFSFDEVIEAFTNRDFELRYLQQLLDKVGISEKDGKIEGELVVRPCSMPNELRNASHGSYSRTLSHDVVETLSITRFNKLNIIEVKPHGAPGGEAGIWAMNARNFRIPLAQVSYLRLDTEEFKFTPWIERTRNRDVLREVEL